MTVAVAAELKATMMEFQKARHNPRSAMSRPYQRREKPFQVMLEESLNE
jgi:hypothetical protein